MALTWLSSLVSPLLAEPLPHRRPLTAEGDLTA
jgi:hypothetical protein